MILCSRKRLRLDLPNVESEVCTYSVVIVLGPGSLLAHTLVGLG